MAGPSRSPVPPLCLVEPSPEVQARDAAAALGPMRFCEAVLQSWRGRIRAEQWERVTRQKPRQRSLLLTTAICVQFMDIWNRLYRERILYIGQDLDDEFANQMVAVLLWLNNEDATKGVQLYFNCPGGEVRAPTPLPPTAPVSVHPAMLKCS